MSLREVYAACAGAERAPNVAETAFRSCAARHGWETLKRGWPDFLLFRDGSIAAVEVKPHGTEPPKDEQLAVMEALAAYGVPCYLWSPSDGFRRIEARTAVK